MISWILIIGVVASVVFESLGLVLNYASTRSLTLTISPEWHVQAPNFFSFVASAIPSALAGVSAVSLVTVGVILLMLTPYVRVVASVIYFALQKDYRYLGITLLVLAIITTSLLLL